MLPLMLLSIPNPRSTLHGELSGAGSWAYAIELAPISIETTMPAVRVLLAIMCVVLLGVYGA
jgi:hypothetical protein